jgi:5-methylcytosine-specific restriction endonuclease McrA
VLERVRILGRRRRLRWYDFEHLRELTRFEEWTSRGPIPGSAPDDLDRETPSRRWKEALRRDPCSYCASWGGTIDHIVPRLRRTLGFGQPQTWLNYTGSCKRCNEAKADSSLLFFLLKRRAPGASL